MKNEIMATVGIFGFISIVAMMAACNESIPVNGSCEPAELALDECLDELSVPAEAVSENVAAEPVENIDWKSIALKSQAEYNAQLELFIEYKDALSLFDMTEVCDSGDAGERVCKSFFNGDL